MHKRRFPKPVHSALKVYKAKSLPFLIIQSGKIKFSIGTNDLLKAGKAFFLVEPPSRFINRVNRTVMQNFVIC